MSVRFSDISAKYIFSKFSDVSSARGIPAISHEQIPVPIWATLPTDPELYPRPFPVVSSPVKIPLDEHSRCSCGATKNACLPTVWSPCKVFGMLHVFICEIETQACPNGCSRGGYRFIGPDGSRIGLFNNRILFTHDLLNDYTLCYTTSETPFTAWVTVTQTRYTQFKYTTDATFVAEEVFRAAWFSFTSLQNFGGEMQCPACGPEPSAVIFDGVTIAFGKKHLTNTLRPPTYSDNYSPVRSCRPVSIQSRSVIVDKSLRQSIKKVINGRSLIIAPNELGQGVQGTTGAGSEMEENSQALDKVLKEVIERIDLIPTTSTRLFAISRFLGDLFHRYCGIRRLAEKCDPPRQLIHLFREVREFGSCVQILLLTILQIAAEGSILQFIPNTSILPLKDFLADPSEVTLPNTKSIPALYETLRYEFSQGGGFCEDTLGVCHWLVERAEEVLALLLQHKSNPLDERRDLSRLENDWRKVTTFLI